MALALKKEETMFTKHKIGLALALVGFGGEAWAGTSYTTMPATNITKTSATLNGYALSTIGLSGEIFHWGTSTQYGNTGAGNPQGVNGPVSLAITDLACSTTYHYLFTGAPKPPRTTTQGVDMQFTTLPCHIAPMAGFTGPFAPNHWTEGENPPMGLIDTTQAPRSISLTNYAPWRSSGSVFAFPSAPSDATVNFTYSLTGATNQCPGSYLVGGKPTILKLTGGTTAFAVLKGQSFAFALNGQSKPDDFACISDGSQVSMTISGFVFTPR